MAAHDAQVRHAKGARGLHIVQLAQFKRLGPQQPSQAGPTGDAQNGGQQEQPHVPTLQSGFKHQRVFVDKHLDHQHKGRNQQHRGNGREHGIKVLNSVVHPALEVTRRNAKHHGQWNGGQRGQRTNHHCGADGLEGQKEHVVAGLVRAHHVVVRPQRGHPAQYQPHCQQRKPHCAHGQRHATLPQRGQRLRGRGAAAARLPQHGQRTQDQRHQCARAQAAQAALAHIVAPLRLGICQVLAAKLQARKVTYRHAVTHHAFLGELVRGQRHRIGFLA